MNGDLRIFWNASVDAGPCHGCGAMDKNTRVLCFQAAFESKRLCLRLCEKCAPRFVESVKLRYGELIDADV